MVNDIIKEMGGCYVSNNAGKLSTTPTTKVLLPGIGVTKVKDLYLVYERWSRKQGRDPKIKEVKITKNSGKKTTAFDDLFDVA